VQERFSSRNLSVITPLRDQSGEVLLADVAGTPDESRYLLGEQHISKQVLRDCYARTDLREQVRLWASHGRPPAEKPCPAELGSERVNLVSDMYKALCERWLQTHIWDAPDLAEVMGALRNFAPLGAES
jgi:phosphoribosylaminoimidazole-succinocarboxamide synthase